jgi:hypothetical protein
MKTSQMQADEAVLNKLAQAYGDESKARELLESSAGPMGRFVSTVATPAKRPFRS